MPRPQPLQNLASGSQPPYHSQLTPRTPHSRATSVGAHDEHPASLPEAQTVPLLRSSDTDLFSEVNLRTPTSATIRQTIYNSKRFRLQPSHVPLLLGILAAVALFILTLLSWTRPQLLNEALFGQAYFEIPGLGSMSSIISNSSRLPEEYLKECAVVHTKPMSHGDFWEGMNMSSSRHLSPIPTSPNEPPVCNGTITYMLDGTVGLVADLAILAQVAAFARERNKTFFVDDTYWKRGKWLDHFEDVAVTQPSPEGRRCLPPRSQDVVACPRSTRHWVVTAQTAKYHLGHHFYDHYENPYGHELNRLKPIYQQGAASFAQTIRPNAKNMAIITDLQKEFATWLAARPWRHRADPYLAVHIRRGDRLGMSWKYHDKHIPTAVYAEAAEHTWARSGTGPVDQRAKDQMQLDIYLASDDPAVHEELEESLKRGTVFSLGRSQAADLRNLSSPAAYRQHEFDSLPEEERIRQTRGMLADLAMISGMWTKPKSLKATAIICGISSAVCDIAAYGFGWEKAFGLQDGDRDDGRMDDARKSWVEIDNAGSVVPAWDAFHLF